MQDRRDTASWFCLLMTEAYIFKKGMEKATLHRSPQLLDGMPDPGKVYAAFIFVPGSHPLLFNTLYFI